MNDKFKSNPNLTPQKSCSREEEQFWRLSTAVLLIEFTLQVGKISITFSVVASKHAPPDHGIAVAAKHKSRRAVPDQDDGTVRALAQKWIDISNFSIVLPVQAVHTLLI